MERVLGHAFRQVHQAVVVADINSTDVLAFQLRFVGDRADDVAGLHAMIMADLDAEGFHVGVALAVALFLCLALFLLAAEMIATMIALGFARMPLVFAHWFRGLVSTQQQRAISLH